jgi:hypothetical protein
MNNYHNPKNEQMLDELYAWILLDECGEGIVSAMIADKPFPLVFGDKKLIELTRMPILNVCQETGKTVRLVKYKREEILETIEGTK